MPRGAFLLIVRRGNHTESHPFDQDVVTIGRSHENDLFVADRLVSRRHCELHRPDGAERFVIRDCGAANPVKISGVTIEEAQIDFGDTFHLGNTEVRVLAPIDDSPTVEETQHGEPQQTAKDLAALFAIARALNEERDLNRLLTAIVDAAIHLTGAERGFLVLGQAEESTVEIARNFAQEEVHTPEFKISRTIAQRVMANGVAELTTNAQADDRFRGLASVEEMRLRSVVCIPLRIRGAVEGVLYVDNRLQDQVFLEREKSLLVSLADHAGIAIHNARTMNELRAKQSELETAVDRVAQLNAALKGQVREQQTELESMRSQLSESRSDGRGFRYDYSTIIGESRRMREMFALLDKYIEAADPVMILGESGTGKELIARVLHRAGPRRGKPFVSENCAALPESLLESELFGYAKGAFTGAASSRKGLLVSADGGVLFLDEIGEMPLDLQKKLLRVLQEGEVRPLGSHETVSVDVRVVAATNRNLEEMVREGDFREDLYYRLAVLPVHVPALRERRDDIPMLVDRFLLDIANENGGPRSRVSADAMAVIAAYRWPGNVRELQNEIRRAAILSDGVVLVSHLSESVRDPATDTVLDGVELDDGQVPVERGTTLPDMVRALEEREIGKALRQAESNKSRAAEMLGLSRFALQRKLDKYGLGDDGDIRDGGDEDS